MKWWVSVVVPFITFAAMAKAESRVDLDFVGLQSRAFPCSQLAAATRGRSIALGLLHNSFNPDPRSQWACIKKLSPRIRVIRVALINDTCNRAGRSCARHEFLRGINDRDFSRRLERLGSAPIPKLTAFLENARDGLFSAIRPDTACYVSPMLEASHLTRKAAQNLTEHVREVFGPRCAIVWNPLQNATFSGRLPNTFLERHGRAKLAPPCSYTNDGTPLSLSELKTVTRQNRRCVFSGAWQWSGNGVKKYSDRFVPPNKRKHFPTRRELDRLVRAVEYRVTRGY